jgi:hypothetical protein
MSTERPRREDSGSFGDFENYPLSTILGVNQLVALNQQVSRVIRVDVP